MKILFITYIFPPFNAIGSVRTGKTAKFLVESGHDVKVISCAKQSLSKNLSLEISEQSVQYTDWINVNSPVEFILGGKKKVASKGYYPIVKNLPGWIFRLGCLYRSILNFPDGQIGWFPFAKRSGDRLIQQWKPDLIFSSAVPYTSLLIASTLSRKHKIPWIAELRDLWIDNHYRIHPVWRRKLEERLERFTLSTAIGLVTVSDPLNHLLKSKYPIPCATITNGFDPEDYPETTKISFSNGKIHLTYTGQLYSLKRVPTPLFIALNKMGADAEKVRVHFYGRYLDFAYEYARKYNVDHLVEIHEPVSHSEALNIQTKADVLLLFPGYDVEDQGIFTGKIFEYLGARRPILCIGNTEGVAANLISERKAGISLNEPEKIALQLRYWIKEKSENGEIPFLSSEVGKGFTRKEQTQKLMKFFETCLNKSVST